MDLDPLHRLSRDLVRAAATMSPQEARYLVDAYYQHQEHRKRAANQVRAAGAEPHATLEWLNSQEDMLEAQIKRALDGYAADHPVMIWMRSLYGIGPVISAGVMAHIDIRKAPTAGHIWRFAGLDPTSKWNKGEPPPWNANLKVLCWKIGQSFMKFSGQEECFYGHLYLQRKVYEIARNDSGGNAARAAAKQANFAANSPAKKYIADGKLPPFMIDAQARRWAVKIFLAHLQQIWWWCDTGKPPPLPFALTIPTHVHFIPPPGDLPAGFDPYQFVDDPAVSRDPSRYVQPS